MSKITQLTLEQEALISIYREKWRKIALSTERVDKKRAVESIQAVYNFLGYSEPEILFFESTKALAQNIQCILEERIPNLSEQTKEPVLKRIGNRLGKPFADEIKALYRQVCVDIATEYFAVYRITLNLDLSREGNHLHQMYNLILSSCSQKIKQELNFQNYKLKYTSAYKLENKLKDKFFENIFPFFLYSNDCLLIDYCYEVLNLECNLTLWKILKELCVDCGLIIIPFQSISLVCDRPQRILLYRYNCLHSEREAAIEYKDKLKIYEHQSLAPSEKFGNVPPKQLNAEWLLLEPNQILKKIFSEKSDNQEH